MLPYFPQLMCLEFIPHEPQAPWVPWNAATAFRVSWNGIAALWSLQVDQRLTRYSTVDKIVFAKDTMVILLPRFFLIAKEHCLCLTLNNMNHMKDLLCDLATVMWHVNFRFKTRFKLLPPKMDNKDQWNKSTNVDKLRQGSCVTTCVLWNCGYDLIPSFCIFLYLFVSSETLFVLRTNSSQPRSS